MRSFKDFWGKGIFLTAKRHFWCYQDTQLTDVGDRMPELESACRWRCLCWAGVQWEWPVEVVSFFAECFVHRCSHMRHADSLACSSVCVKELLMPSELPWTLFLSGRHESSSPSLSPSSNASGCDKNGFLLVSATFTGVICQVLMYETAIDQDNEPAVPLTGFVCLFLPTTAFSVSTQQWICFHSRVIVCRTWYKCDHLVCMF